jgi:hypothetical protein
VTGRARRIVLAAAVLPLVVLIGVRSAWAAYACTIDGQVRSACCCPQGQDAERPVDEPSRIDVSCCCDISMGESSTPPDVRLNDPSRVDDVPAVAIAVLPEPAPRTVMPAARITRARPPPLRSAVPAYLANRTILR